MHPVVLYVKSCSHSTASAFHAVSYSPISAPAPALGHQVNCSRCSAVHYVELCQIVIDESVTQCIPVLVSILIKIDGDITVIFAQ